MKGLKFVRPLASRFKKISQDGVINKTAYFNKAPKTVINVYDFHPRDLKQDCNMDISESNLSMDIG